VDDRRAVPVPLGRDFTYFFIKIAPNSKVAAARSTDGMACPTGSSPGRAPSSGASPGACSYRTA
jgi:hypothetical protein